MSDIEFLGETFKVRPKREYEYALCDFAEVADSIDAQNLLTSYKVVKTLLRAAIVDEDFDRFWSLVQKHRVGIQPDGETEGLMTVAVQLFWQVAERPTGLPSDSSGGRQITPESSEVASYRQVVEREEASGRPDRALMVKMAQEATA